MYDEYLEAVADSLRQLGFQVDVRRGAWENRRVMMVQGTSYNFYCNARETVIHVEGQRLVRRGRKTWSVPDGIARILLTLADKLSRKTAIEAVGNLEAKLDDLTKEVVRKDMTFGVGTDDDGPYAYVSIKARDVYGLIPIVDWVQETKGENE